jgi:hypothetical protein
LSSHVCTTLSERPNRDMTRIRILDYLSRAATTCHHRPPPCLLFGNHPGAGGEIYCTFVDQVSGQRVLHLLHQYFVHSITAMCTGWLVSIAYIEPGNYQADIQAGATTQYSLLFSIWWSSVLSIYVQILCVRLGYYTQHTLAQVQAREYQNQNST